MSSSSSKQQRWPQGTTSCLVPLLQSLLGTSKARLRSAAIGCFCFLLLLAALHSMRDADEAAISAARRSDLARASRGSGDVAAAARGLVTSSPPPLTRLRPAASSAVVVLFWTTFWGGSFESAMHEQQSFLPSWPCSRHCELTYDRGRVRDADAVLFHAANYLSQPPPSHRSASQLWIFFNLEPPTFGFTTTRHDHVFNATMTYRRDSDLPVGYGHFSAAAAAAASVNRSLPDPIVADFERRRPRAYWMVGNCAGDRMAYVRQLSAHIEVDIVGKCAPPGSIACSGSRDVTAETECELQLSSTHAFYLAFENSLCPDYVTEKLWRALASPGGAIPVVIGARLSDYEALVPPDSFIHAENFTSARELGAFLAKVASSRDAFLYYHRWRSSYDVSVGWYHELARGVCRLCESLHRGELRSMPVKADLSRWANAGCRTKWPQ